MRKTFVFDTSVLVSDPYCYKHFHHSDIVIPIAVLNELDNLKKQFNGAGKNARICIKVLDEISSNGDISTGILLDNDILLKVDATYYDLNDDRFSGFGNPQYGDTQILACLYSNWLSHPNQDVTLASNDINLRIKAKSRNIDATGYDSDNVSLSELYSGIQIIKNEQAGLDLQSKSSIDPNYYGLNLLANECVVFEGNDGNTLVLARKVASDKIKVIKKNYPWGITAKNKEQAFAIDLIMDSRIDLVTLIGKAGTGKSLVALASALDLVINKKDYERFVIYRPIQAVGNDIGYLPGTLEEKLAPWFQAIMDNFEYLLGNKPGSDWRKELEMFQKKGRIEMEAITYIRGRSIPNAIILVDECFPYNQNISTEFGKMKIGKIYEKFKNNEILPLIKSYNEKDEKFEFKKITNVWNRGEKNLLEIKCANRKIKCTPNHKFLTNNGWIEASYLKVGNLIKTSEPIDHQLINSVNDDQRQIILGSFLGDGNLDCVGRSRYRLRVIHGIDQKNYCEWMANIFNSHIEYIEKNGYSKKPAVRFQSLVFGMEQLLPQTKTFCPQWVLDELDERGLAIWFMDDGSVNKNYNEVRISTCSFDEDSQKRMVSKLQSMGIYCKYSKLDGEWYITVSADGCIQLFDLISPYMHQDLSYKTNTIIGDYNWNNKFYNHGYTVVDNIINIDNLEEVYDIEIEDNHNFIVCSSSQGGNATFSGLIAHNCQNLSKEDVKTILTRAGENTKIILTGDIEQIDNSSLDATSNGLTHVIEKFKNSEMAGHITFTQGERSRLATLAAEIL